MPTLAGEISTFFVLTLLVTAIVSPLVLWRYAAAVLFGMVRQTGPTLPVPPLPPAPAAAAPAARAPVDRAAWQRTAGRRAAAAWLVAFGMCALLLAAVETHVEGSPWAPAPFAGRASIHAMVALPVIAVTLGWTMRQGLGWTLLAFATAATLTTLVAMVSRLAAGHGPVLPLLQVGPQWLLAAAVSLWIPLLMLAASGTARVRGVVPIVFGGLIVFALAPFVGLQLVRALAETALGSAAMLQWPWLGSRHVWFAVLALPFGALMVWRLQVLARRYASKRFSDVEFLARAWWLMYCTHAASSMLAAYPDRLLGALACLCVAAALAPAARLTFGWFGIARGAPEARTLLVLRVFGYRRRTERLLGRIAARWRYQGPVTMIAAPDVTARTIDAADFVHWLLGRTDDSFVRSGDELERRLAAIDRERDPDGRHRVNEFCCTDSTWQATAVELMVRADLILMDLRGMQGRRAGCEFELQQLALRVAPSRVVLVVTPAADRSAIHDMLGPAAQSVGFHELPDRADVDTDGLYLKLLAAADRH